MSNEGDHDEELNKNLAVYGPFAKEYERMSSGRFKIDDEAS